jgi:tetratricopeptide (TPR) repeat protein
MITDLNALASARMESGIALLNAGTPDALREAVGCFEEAIRLRERLPLAENPGFRYGLAGGWINRGDALKRLGGSENLADAVSSYARAIELLEELPATEDGLFVKRLAIAWMNRGIALEEQGSEPALAEASHCFEKAVEVLSDAHHPPDGRHSLVLASAWTNLANALLRSESESPARACATAEKALSLLADSEAMELAAAEAGLKARHIVCQALVASLAVPTGDASTAADLIGRMTDTSEEALRLAHAWEKAGETRFRPMAAQFFHLSALVYERHQPHFLAEFLLDHLDPERATCFQPVNESWMTIGMETALRVRRRFREGDFAWLATSQGRRQIQTLKDLENAEARLRSLQAGASSD